MIDEERDMDAGDPDRLSCLSGITNWKNAEDVLEFTRQLARAVCSGKVMKSEIPSFIKICTLALKTIECTQLAAKLEVLSNASKGKGSDVRALLSAVEDPGQGTNGAGRGPRGMSLNQLDESATRKV